MHQNSDQITVLCGEIPEKDHIPSPLKPFSPEVCDFLNKLSGLLMNRPECREYSDVLTFGFFCRKANILKQKQRYADQINSRLGRGMTFHIAPSNVPVNFAYSLVSALLAGNASVVRVSSKDFEQTRIICDAVDQLLEQPDHSFLKQYISVVRYPHIQEINDMFSEMCDVRVIWGGDNTISEVRQSPLSPRATEITFADRYSAAVFDAGAVLKSDSALMRDFYNDTYLFDQNACSAPRLIYWLGNAESCEKARNHFWDMFHEYVRQHYKAEPIVSVDKYMTACRLAIEHDTEVIKMPDNLISRIKVNNLSADLKNHRCPGGSFIEYQDVSLDALKELITARVQTICYYGDIKDMLSSFVIDNHLTGVDRIVPAGKTSDFDLVWDGYDLILQMSRCISVF